MDTEICWISTWSNLTVYAYAGWRVAGGKERKVDRERFWGSDLPSTEVGLPLMAVVLNRSLDRALAF